MSSTLQQGDVVEYCAPGGLVLATGMVERVSGAMVQICVEHDRHQRTLMWVQWLRCRVVTRRAPL